MDQCARRLQVAIKQSLFLFVALLFHCPTTHPTRQEECLERTVPSAERSLILWSPSRLVTIPTTSSASSVSLTTHRCFAFILYYNCHLIFFSFNFFDQLIFIRFFPVCWITISLTIVSLSSGSGCNLQLNLKTFKKHSGQVWCPTCTPKEKHTQVTDSLLTVKALCTFLSSYPPPPSYELID